MTPSTKRTPEPVPERDVRVRRVRFAHDRDGLRRHYVEGDLIMSHVVAVLSATFPPGEEFFVRSVRRYRDEVTDPELAKQIKGFIGQEIIHGREHDHLNRTLQRMGYPTRRIHKRVDLMLKLAERTLPARACLGFTAGLEHYTATLAETLLSDPRAQAMLGDTEVRSILLWHALEESEHKSVAFDVFRATGGSERARIATMRYIGFGLLLLVISETIISMLMDRTTYRPGRLRRSLGELRHSPFLSPQVVRHIRAYNKKGFHPDDFDSAELLERWRAELFGPEGSLTGNLK